MKQSKFAIQKLSCLLLCKYMYSDYKTFKFPLLLLSYWGSGGALEEKRDKG